MSLDAMRWAWEQRCSPTSKLLLLSLANCCNGKGAVCWPSLTHLSIITGLSRASVCRLLDDLDRAGLVSRERAAGQKSTRYRIAMHPEEVGGQSHHETRGSLTMRPDSLAMRPEVVSPRDQGSLTMRPEPGREPGILNQEENPLGGRESLQVPAREKTESNSKTLSQSPEGGKIRSAGIHIEAVAIDWRGIAEEIRPDIQPEPCWQKFRLYHQGKTKSPETWDAEWRLWVLRERNYSFQHATIANGNNKPGRLASLLGASVIDSTCEIIP